MKEILDWLVLKLKSEPQVVVQAVQTILALLVSIGLVEFTEGQTGAILAVVAAVMAVIIGLSVRPFRWALIVGAAQAVILLLSEFSINLTEEQIGIVYTAITLLGMLARQFLTPEIHLPPEGTPKPIPQ